MTARPQALTHRRHHSSPLDFFGNGKNIGFPSCNLFFKAGWSKWGNLESLLHSPQQQCFVATICSIKYPTTHRFSSCRIIVLSAMFVRPLLGVQKWRNLFLVRPRVALTRVVWPHVTNVLDLLYFCENPLFYHLNLIPCRYWSWQRNIYFLVNQFCPTYFSYVEK